MKKENNKEQLPWTYVGQPVSEQSIPSWAVGFVYAIIDSSNWTNTIYIGKKLLHSERKVRIGKRAIAAERASRKDGKAHTVRRIRKESDWKDYLTSCKPLQELMKANPGRSQRCILSWAYSKKNLTYLEIKMICVHGMLEKESFNDNLQGTIYRVDCNKYLWEQSKKKT